MIKLKGDKDGFAGRYEGQGFTWTVSKFYLGRGLGAGWKVEGKFFDPHSTFNWKGIKEVIENWENEGVGRV